MHCNVSDRKQKALLVVYLFYAPIVAFLANRKQYCHLVLYEDLADNPTLVVKTLLSAHPAEHLPFALDALGKDSQAGMFGGRGSSGEPEDHTEALEEVEKISNASMLQLSQ